MNTVLLDSKLTCPPLSSLVYTSKSKDDPFVVDSDYDSNASESGDEGKPLYFRQHYALTTFMKSWIRKDPQFNDDTITPGYPDATIGNTNISKKLLQLEYGYILKNMLEATGVRWVSATKSQIATQARTYANHSVTALWTHIHHGLKFLEKNEVWSLREELHAYLTSALGQWPGFWDDISEQPGGSSPDLTQTTISRPRKLELETTAKEMERRTEEAFLKITQILLLPELGSIPTHPSRKDSEVLLTNKVCQKARALMKVVFHLLLVSISVISPAHRPY